MERKEIQQAHLPTVLLLLLLRMWKETQAWPSSLRYDLFLVSQLEPSQSIYKTCGYVNNQLFLHYDGEKRRTELQKPWSDAEEGGKAWERITWDLEEKGKELQVILQDILGQNNQSNSSKGPHTLQATLSCELQDNSGTKGFWKLLFDGQDYSERLNWTADQPKTQIIKEKWEDGFQMKLHKVQVEEYCSLGLQRYLASWNRILEKTEPPSDVPHGPNTMSHRPLQVELLIIGIGLVFAVLLIVGAQLWRRIPANTEIRPSRSEWKSAHPLFPGFGRFRETQSMV